MKQREHRKNLFRMFRNCKGEVAILLGMALFLVLFFGEVDEWHRQKNCPMAESLADQEIYVVDENGNYTSDGGCA